MRVQLWMLGAGAALAVVGYGLDAAAGADAASGDVSFGAAVWTADPHSSGLLEVIGSGGFALAVIGLCLLAVPDRAHLGRAAAARRRGDAAHRLHGAARGLGDRRHRASSATRATLRGFRDLEPFWPMTITLVIALHGVGAAGRPRSARMGRRPRFATADRCGVDRLIG